MKNLIQLIVFCLLINLPLHAQSKKEKKLIKATEDFEHIKAVIESGEFDFQADWAIPLQGRRVNLISNSNFLKFRKDSADIFLPFFGTLHSGVSVITGQGGIVFQGIVKNYEMAIDENKQKISLSFSAQAKNDIFDFDLTIFPEGKTLMNVNSNFRSTIKYDGKTKQVKPKE